MVIGHHQKPYEDIGKQDGRRRRQEQIAQFPDMQTGSALFQPPFRDVEQQGKKQELPGFNEEMVERGVSENQLRSIGIPQKIFACEKVNASHHHHA